VKIEDQEPQSGTKKLPESAPFNAFKERHR